METEENVLKFSKEKIVLHTVEIIMRGAVIRNKGGQNTVQQHLQSAKRKDSLSTQILLKFPPKMRMKLKHFYINESERICCQYVY
jgi:hypothetical protein